MPAKRMQKFIPLSLILATLFSLFSAGPTTAVLDQEEKGQTTYEIVDSQTPTVAVTSTIVVTNNKPPKVVNFSCTRYRQEPYQSYESYQRYEVVSRYWVNGYYYYGRYYSGYYRDIYGWRTYYEWVTRYRSVSYLDTCTSTTNYVVPTWEGAVPAEATNVTATVNGKPTSVSKLERYTSDGVQYQDVRINSSVIRYGENRKFKLSYVLKGKAPRTNSVTRLNSAYVGFCPIGYGRQGGKVTVQIPNRYDLVQHSTNWQVSSIPGQHVLTWQNSNNAYSTLGCISALNLAAAKKVTLTSLSGKSVNIYAWPDDTIWAAKTQEYLARNLDNLEAFTGLSLTQDQRPLNIAESGFADLSGVYSGIYNPKTNLIQLSEKFDEETLVHELSHVWFNDKMPRWLAEGLAQWVSKRVVAQQLGGPLPKTADSACALFDPKKALPGKTVKLDAFGNSSFGTQTDVAVVSAQYALSCGVMANILDSFTKDERARFLNSILKFGDRNPWGYDVGSVETSDIRKLADAAAMSYLAPDNAALDEWLVAIKYGELVGIEPDAILSDASRINALSEFGRLTFQIRKFGWNDLDAPLGVRQEMANGNYSILDDIDLYANELEQDFPFFTKEEISSSKLREVYRASYTPNGVIPVIAKSGSNLSAVGRSWWSDHGVVHSLGAIILGDPEALRDQALAALREGDAKLLLENSTAAERAATWSGLLGLILIILLISGLIWGAFRKHRKLPIVPSQLKSKMYPLKRRAASAKKVALQARNTFARKWRRALAKQRS